MARGSGPVGALGTQLRALFVDDLPDLVLGSRCVGCDRPGRALCTGCRCVLDGPARRTAPVPEPPGLPPVWAMASYGGVVRSALIAHKERGRVTLAAPLGTALAGAIEAADGSAGRAARAGGELLVVPVPSAGRAVRARGYDPLLAICRQAVRRLRRSDRGRGVRLVRPVRLTRRVADQSELGASERLANLAGAFTIPARGQPMIRGRSVVLVDDLITTGATLQAVADALHDAGARVQAAAVIAATQRDTRR